MLGPNLSAVNEICKEEGVQTGERSESSITMWNSWRSSKRYLLGGEKNGKGHGHSFQISEELLLHVEEKSYFFCEALRAELGILRGYTTMETIETP